MRTVALPDKKYFKIGEVADLVGVEPHVLRYWETQFPQVRPHKARSGHRLYRRKDVETLLAIRDLLHVQRFTIAGARLALRQHLQGGNTTTPPGFADPQLDAELAALEREAAGEEALDADVTTAPDLVEVEVSALSDEGLAIALSREVAEQSGASIEVEVAPSPPPSRRRADPRAQLGFGFPTSGRAILEAARADLRALTAVLDREDARDRRMLQSFGAHGS